QPMRWATAGGILAGRGAVGSGVAFNLGGGFHHAKPTQSEGVSIYNDIAVIIQSLRREERVPGSGRIAEIDLDAPIGKRVAWCFLKDASVFLFDMHNGSIYAGYDVVARKRIDCSIPLRNDCRGGEYLGELQKRLPPFLDSIGRSSAVSLAIYNAGTDVLAED